MTFARTLAVLLCVIVTACGQPRAPTNAARIGIVLEPPNLDPTAGAAAAIDEVVYANVFEGLTRIDETGGVLPALAATWDISPDRLTYTFHLRAKAKFHDGSTFDASDAKFSLDRARGPDSTNAQKGFFEPIASVTVINPATLQVVLSRPVSDFLFDMGSGDAVIVAPETAAKNASKPIGTGPFRFSRWLKGTQIELARNDTYWGTPAKLDKLVFLIIPDPSAAYAALLAGDVDSFPNFPAPELLPQIEDDPRFEIAIGTTEGETILAMNNTKPPLDDIRIRRAISHAIDRKALIDGVGEGYGTSIGSHFAPHNKAYIDLTGRYPFDVAKAKALLAEAGRASDITLTLRLPPAPYARRGGEVIAAQLKAIGITAKIENIEWAQWLDQVFGRGDFDLTIVSHTEPNDIGIYARDEYYFHYAKPEFKALMKSLDLAATDNERIRILQDAQRMLADDAVNGFLFQLPKIGVWNKRLIGQWKNSPVQANDMTAAHWERK
ncbi:MAG: ABC transporter substrate-binding protein [Alphaproteobacteria bacterium]|nr:ABC transporter substrate-binding protein [Alphaproteobacteria bacterium]